MDFKDRAAAGPATAAVGAALFLFPLFFSAPAEAISLKKLAANLKATGRDYTVPESMAADLGLSRSVTAKYQEVDDVQTGDETYRVVFLFGRHEKPEGFIFMTNRVKNYRYEKFYCRTDMAGSPKAGFLENGEIYPDGTRARGAPSIKRFVAGDAVLSQRLPRELDFWLRGRRRYARPDPYDQPDPNR